jgi:hypothetical protein
MYITPARPHKRVRFNKQCSIETYEVFLRIRHSHEQVVLLSPTTNVVSQHDALVLANA